jgi:aminobenzoyl-glutamate transport protein
VLAAYRVGDSPINIVTPIMAYFPLIVVFAPATTSARASAP